jgi:hypothetical protein
MIRARKIFPSIVSSEPTVINMTKMSMLKYIEGNKEKYRLYLEGLVTEADNSDMFEKYSFVIHKNEKKQQVFESQSIESYFE